MRCLWVLEAKVSFYAVLTLDIRHQTRVAEAQGLVQVGIPELVLGEFLSSRPPDF